MTQIRAIRIPPKKRGSSGMQERGQLLDLGSILGRASTAAIRHHCAFLGWVGVAGQLILLCSEG